VLCDLATFAGAAWLASYLLERPIAQGGWSALALAAVVRVWAFVRLGMYRSALRYSGIHTLVISVAGVALGSIAAVAGSWFGGHGGVLELGRAFLVLEALLAVGVTGGARMAARMALERCWGKAGTRVLIYGAGDLGEVTLRILRRHPQWRPIGFLDDDRHKHGQVIHGRPVLGGLQDLDRVCNEHTPQAVFVAINNLDPQVANAICRACMSRDLRVTVVRGVDGEGGSLRLRDLKLEDLLPRPSRQLDPAPVRAMLAGRTVLVTGAGGSIGSELCAQIALAAATELVLVDHSEFNLYAVEQALKERFPQVRLVPVLDNLSDAERVRSLLTRHRPAVVFHAAAYKHVPMVEANPFAAVINNVLSFRNLLAAADHVGVERLVLISTDKAVRPTNVMGATKRVCELLMQNWPTRHTRMCSVRFGNVLGSSGSVVPRFLEQIEAGGPVTVTHPDITRYFMLIPEAVALVLAAGSMADHGEIFILDMGEPVRIADMARKLIFLAGKHPDEIKVAYTGLRPGEKLYEELLLGESERGTAVPGITVGKPTLLPFPRLANQIEALIGHCRERELAGFTRTLRDVVPEWTPSEQFAAVFSGELPAVESRAQFQAASA
jgi:FlaA1/EpsC-like NDP-sugar epimerase